jgi:hypothetical protein
MCVISGILTSQKHRRLFQEPLDKLVSATVCTMQTVERNQRSFITLLKAKSSTRPLNDVPQHDLSGERYAIAFVDVFFIAQL